MIVRSMSLIGLGFIALSACTSIPELELIEFRASLLEKTDTALYECICPTPLDLNSRKSPAPDGNIRDGNIRIGEGSISNEMHPEVQKRIDRGMSSIEAVKAYADQVGDQTHLNSNNNIFCWTGTCGPGEYSITNLDDIKILRAFISIRPKAHAHQCTFAKNPKLLTTEACPELPTKSEFKKLKERLSNG